MDGIEGKVQLIKSIATNEFCEMPHDYSSQSLVVDSLSFHLFLDF